MGWDDKGWYGMIRGGMGRDGMGLDGVLLGWEWMECDGMGRDVIGSSTGEEQKSDEGNNLRNTRGEKRRGK